MVAARRVRSAMEQKGAAEAVPAASISSGDEEAESDEAPEEVTFESARAAAEEARRLAGERARREKATVKEKRKQREELFKEQKKRKLLPENVLEELASTSQDSENLLSDTPEEGHNVEDKPEHGNSDKDTKEGGEEEILENRLQESYMAVRLKDQDLTNKQQQKAKTFIQRQLYGAGHNRTTANQYFSAENKRSVLKKAAIQFVNNSWGKMEKQKAKKFTKHWISSKISS